MSSTHQVPRVRVVGNSEAILNVEYEALIAARGDAHVLITGEPGVGKAVVARFIHENSDRSAQGFATINCKSLPDVLFESAMFGHVQGSFAGAYRDKPGVLDSVHDGTIFLEEVSALSLGMQARLLRFLETGEYVRIGVDRVEIRHRVRVMASTTADLPARVAAGLFLEALYKRLSAVRLSVPPLRERRDDIPTLVDHFAGQVGEGRGADISVDTREALSRAEWPGNVQQLKAVVLRQLLGRGRRVLNQVQQVQQVLQVRGVLIDLALN